MKIGDYIQCKVTNKQYQIIKLQDNGLIVGVNIHGDQGIATFEPHEVKLIRSASNDNVKSIVIPNSFYRIDYDAKNPSVLTIFDGDKNVTDSIATNFIRNMVSLFAITQGVDIYTKRPSVPAAPVTIRKETSHDKDILDMLVTIATDMSNKIAAAGIQLDSSIKVWVKEHTLNGSDEKTYYPKIEIDCGQQELQYDMTLSGEIREIHFKSFKNIENGKKQRVDVNKSNADRTLSLIDDVIRDII